MRSRAERQRSSRSRRREFLPADGSPSDDTCFRERFQLNSRPSKSLTDYFLIVLTQARRTAHDSPRRARELAWSTRHPHFARRGMVDLDEKFARLVLLVAR